MKRNQWITVLLAALLTVLLCACSTDTSKAEPNDKAKLVGILDNLSGSVERGTAGSTLKAVKIAADLISWASSTEMSPTETAAVVAEWVDDLPQERKDAFRDQVEQVAEAYGKIAIDGAKELLEDAGAKIPTDNLGGRLKEVVEAILATGGV